MGEMTLNVTMRYDDFIEVLKEFKRCQLTELETVIKELSIELKETDNNVNGDIIRLGINALDMETFIGDIDDFHNVAVTFAKIDLYDMACLYLEKGLELFPYSVDLLADYIIYGLSCGNIEKCSKYYDVLKDISVDRWTWRCYTFSADYLLTRLAHEILKETDIEKIKEEIINIAINCQKRLPNEEYGYLIEAKTYREFNLLHEEKQVLEKCIESVKISPKCSMRLADTYYKEGNFEEALRYVNKCINDDISTVAKLNKGYPHYLQALCMISSFYRDIDINIEEVEDAIEDVYLSCRLAKRTLKDIEKLENLQLMIDILEIKTGIICD